MSRKILFLAPEFPPLGVTGAIRPAKFAKYLYVFGFDVTVLTFDHDDDKHQDLLSDLNGVEIIKLGKTKSFVINDLGVNFLFQARRVVFDLVKEMQPDYLFVSMPTFFNSLLAWEVKKKLNINYVLDYRDLWVGDPYRSKSFKSKIFRMLSFFLEPIVLKSAYLSCYVSEEMLADQMRIYHFLKNKKHLVISTGYDSDDLEGICFSEKRKNNYISHIGNADYDMNLHDFVELVKNARVQGLLEEYKLKFLFVGSKNHHIKKLINKDLNKYFEFMGYLQHDKAMQLMADSKGLLILGSNSPQRLNRKVFEYTALNKKVFYLGSSSSPTAKVVNQFGGVVSNNYDSLVKLAGFIEGINDGKGELNTVNSKRELVKKLYNEL